MEQGVSPQEEPETGIQPEPEPEPEPSEDGLGSPVTLGRYKMKGLDHIRTAGLR